MSIQYLKPYYTLACKGSDGKWFADFGDYDSQVVSDEKFDRLWLGDYKRNEMKIVRTTEAQTSIDCAIYQLNAKEI